MIDRLNAVLPSVVTDLKRLVAIPSVSSQEEHHDDVLAAADAVTDLLRDLGADDVKLLDGGGKPAVYGHFPAPEGQPTVLLYAHYDVQPTGDPAGWTTDAFSAMERDGRLYGRGAADDKGGIAVHLAALRAFDGKPPVGVKVFIEGEEEMGSPSMQAILDTYPEETAADIYVIADSMNWKVGQPGLTTTLRGLVDAVVTVSTLEAGVHSGQFGGLVPDGLTALCRLLATLHDDEGNVAIDGPRRRPRPRGGLRRGVAARRVRNHRRRRGWAPASSRPRCGRAQRPPCSPSTRPRSGRLQHPDPDGARQGERPHRPEPEPEAAEVALRDHLLANAPWGAKVEVKPERGGAGTRIDLTDPRAAVAVEALREAFGVDPVEMGVGGSIPIANEFAERNPGCLVLLTGVVDPTSRMHGLDESMDMGDFAKAALAETLLLAKLAR